MNDPVTGGSRGMRRCLAFPLLACVGVLGALAPAASAAANPDHSNCFALFVSNSEPGNVGSSASSNAQDPEARPFGLNLVSFTAHVRGPECGE
jgi:hypothetical protein